MGLAVVAGLALALGVAGCCEEFDTYRELDSGVSADLDAVAGIVGEAGYLAVGPEGTVVRFGGSNGPVDWSVAEGVELHGVVTTQAQWWVVGEAGQVVVTDDRGETWSNVDLGTTSDLYGIAQLQDRLIVIGDETLRVREQDGAWVEPPGPAGGWGPLRALGGELHVGPVFAVGLDGIIVTAEAPSGPWIAESSGTEADLLGLVSHYLGPVAGGGFTYAAVGTDGTVTVRDPITGSWTPQGGSLPQDVVAISWGYYLLADGRVWGSPDLGAVPGGRAMIATGDIAGTYALVVGEDGLAVAFSTGGRVCPWTKV